MGAVGAIIGGTVLGLGAAAMSKKPSFSMPTTVQSAMAPSMPETPQTPTQSAVQSETGTTENALMEAERERARQQALLRQQQAQEVFTSGLGASGMAETSKKTLLGG